MKLIRGLYNLRPKHQQGVATIGNFDGVHHGHLSVLRQLSEQARRLGCQSTVITFEPLPHEYFMGTHSPSRLTPLCEKLKLMSEKGIDQTLYLPFHQPLAEMTAENFIQKVLVDGLAIRMLIVGDDFRFGKGRTGDFSMLLNAGKKYGFEVKDTQTFSDQSGRVSSSRIREALAKGDMKTAQKLLGRPFTMSGRVIHGKKLGRQLGFPTANIRIGRSISPLRGVFAIRSEGIGNGVANVGTRPTVDGKSFLIEAHFLDYSADLYGQRLNIEWLNKIRSEQKFESIDQLKQQIGKDIETARGYFSTYLNS
ncbi:MAG: bifunctional riboflavin kinase/FAD synthetase [Thiothrix sp.]|nr:MAG: bifunctional riboflavin kinase/FAD synthetase [Thiothrix sp.]